MNIFENCKYGIREMFARKGDANLYKEAISPFDNPDIFNCYGINDMENVIDCIGYEFLQGMNQGIGFIRPLSRIYANTNLTSSFPHFGGYGITTNGEIIVDYWDGSSKDYYDKYLNDKNTFKTRHLLGKFNPAIDSIEFVEVDAYGNTSEFVFRTTENPKGEKSHSLSALIMLMMAYILTLSEKEIKENDDKYFGDTILIVRDSIDRFFESLANGEKSLGDDSLIVTNDFYCLLFLRDKLNNETNFEVGDAKRSFDKLFYTNRFPSFDPKSVKVKEFFGDSSLFGGEEKASVKKVSVVGKKVIDFVNKGEYTLSDRELSSQEIALIPKMDDFIPTEEVISTARSIKMSSTRPSPQRTFLWKGETGTGKTTGCQMLAQILGQPYYPMALSGNTYSDDLLTVITPNVDKISKEEYNNKMSMLPSFKEMVDNPVESYEKITGEVNAIATFEDCQKAVQEYSFNLLQKAKDFLEVPSPLFYALTQGGVCEMIEANVVKGAQLKVLNSVMDDLNVVYVNGKVYHRHPDCVVIATYNTGAGYEGIQPFGKDFRSRCKGARTFHLPTDDELINRASIACENLVGVDTLNRMLDVYHRMEEVVNQYGDVHDVISPRQFTAWADETAICGNPYEAAINTIINVATDDEDLNNKLIETLSTQFTKTGKSK